MKSLQEGVMYEKGDEINQDQYDGLCLYEKYSFINSELYELNSNYEIKNEDNDINTVEKAISALFGDSDTEMKIGITINIQPKIKDWTAGYYY
jgi:hypothetical protein